MQFMQATRVAITNASISVSGNVNATITNASIPVTGTVSISGTPNVNVTGGSITISSGTVTATISGTPTVNIAAGQSVSISGTPNVNVTGGSISITSGSVSISGNVTVENVSGNSLSIGSQADILGTFTGVTVGSSINSPTFVVASNAYDSLAFLVQVTGGSGTPYCAYSSRGSITFVAALLPSPLGAGFYECITGMACKSGDALNLIIEGPSTITSMSVTIDGLTHSNPRLRLDGRSLPSGARLAEATVAALSGVRYLIKAITIGLGFSGGNGFRTYNVSITVNGATGIILNCGGATAAGGGSAVLIDDNGILCDTNTAITIASTTAGTAPSQDGSSVSILYDIVV